ncbi:hypothetical protein ACS0TY_017448 [Phlomoides rotata]
MKQCADTEGTTQLDKTIPTREQQRVVLGKGSNEWNEDVINNTKTLTQNWNISGFGFEETRQ